MTSVSTSPIESILATDVGSTMTKATLIDVVEGEYRIIAHAEFPSTLEPPWSDIALAVQQCVSRIEEIAARKLLDDQGTLISPERVDGNPGPQASPADARMRVAQGNGVDAFVATASAAEPLRVIIAGLMRDFSIESARKASAATYTTVESLLALDSQTGAGKRWDLPARISALHEHKPGAIILVGGSDKGANATLVEIANAVAMACATWPEAIKPDVIFAGNAAARSEVADLIGHSAPLSVVENVRPTVQSENLEPLESELESLYAERRLNRLPGIGKLTASSAQPVVATSKAFGAGVRALARHFELNALGIDIGGATTTLCCAAFAALRAKRGHRATLAVSKREQFIRVQRSDLGVSHNIEQVARAAGMENVLRWLPVPMSADEAWDRLANKSLRPFTLPETRKDLLLEHAIAREAMRLTLTDLVQRWPHASRQDGTRLPIVDLIVAAGGVLTHASYPGQTVLLLLDGLQPVGVVNLALDSGGLLTQLSLVASIQPQAAAQLSGREGLTALGTAICPLGPARAGEVVLTYKLTYPDRSGGTVSGEVRAGEIEVLPLGPGQKAPLELKPARNIDLGQGRGRTGVTTVEGGTVGLIMDARGRPLVLPTDPEQRAEVNQRWSHNVGA